jgi:DNA sulfur modification protein DndE
VYPDTIRLSSEAKNQLIRLKSKTGIKNWNTLCRWALCVSFTEPSPPLVRDIIADSNVEMTWKTFAGQWSEIYFALLKQRCVADGREVTAENLAYTLQVYLHRGIGYLSGSSIKTITDLIDLAVEPSILFADDEDGTTAEVGVEERLEPAEKPYPKFPTELTGSRRGLVDLELPA